MRSQKQVRRAVKVRSLKNAAAGKWKTYRRRLEDRKAWQNNATLTGHHHSNTLAPPPPKHRRIKEPKQRSPEELAERQHLREQRRLEKKLAKQRASTSTLPETKKEKKLKEVSSNDSPKKVSAEQNIAAKTVKAKNSTIKETAKTKRLMNESESKHQCLKEERSVSAEEQKICQSSSPVEIEQKELVQSKKHNDVNKTGKKLLEKRGRIEEINKKTKNDKMQPSIPAQIIKLQEPVVPTVLHSVIKEIQQDFLADSDVIDTAEVGTTHEFLKEKAGKKEREIVQLGQLTNEDEKSEIHVNRGKAEGINKEQKKKKRNRRSDADSLLSEHDFVEGDTCEMDYEEASADFTGIVGCRQKKKEGRRDEQQPKFVECSNKAQNENDKVTQSISVRKSKDQIRKQGENIAEKKENKGTNEAVVDLTKNQNCTLENTGFKNEKIVDVTFSDGKISRDLEISRIEVSMKTSIPEELEMKMAKLTEGHSEPLDTTNRSLIGNDVGNVSVTSFAKEAKYEANVEKMKSDVLVLQRDKVNHVPPARERIYKLLPRDIKFCVYMIEKHGEDYETMAKDQGNIFRDSAKGIARRIRIFKESPQYEAYLKQKVEKNGSIA